MPVGSNKYYYFYFYLLFCDVFSTTTYLNVICLFQAQSVPKVIVMGSSTASETTINTSTDSSNTIVTTMTATDGDATEDSLDMNEHDILNSDNILDGKLGSQILQPVPVTPMTPATAKQQTPPTAKEERKFNFDLVPSPKTAHYKGEQKFNFDQVKIEQNSNHEAKNSDQLMPDDKVETRRRNSYKAAQEDFDKIEVVRDGSLDSPKEHRKSIRRGDSPRRSSINSSPDKHDTHSPKTRQRHKRSSRKHHSPNRQHHSPNRHKNEKFTYDEKHIAR